MPKLQIPVTATNVACELFNRVYDVAVKAKYLIGEDWCEDKDLTGLSLYLYLDSSSCTPDIDEKCLVGKLYKNDVPCTRQSNTYDCGMSITQVTGNNCEIIDITIL